MSDASAIYEGWVRHRRFEPVEHSFVRRLYMVYLDLDELPGVLDRSRLWSARRPAPAWFRRGDYLGDPGVPLRTAVLDLVEERTGQRPAGPVRVLTQARTLGFCFNPVSFYYCWHGAELAAVAAEVTNTPWGERHAYVVERGDGQGRVLSGRFGKSLHVSPFHPMDHAYEWRLSEPRDDLQVHIENHADERAVFDATLALRRRELTPANLRRVLVRHPAMAAQVTAGIYAHALLLKLKGAPYHPHPAR